MNGVGQAKARATVGFFAAVLLATSAIDFADPAPRVKAQFDVAALADAERAAARWADGSAARLCEQDLRALSRVGFETRPFYGAALFGFLGATPPGVARDADGRLYIRARSTRRTGAAREIGGEVGAIVAAVARRFAERGSRLVFCPVPEKDLVDADRAPPGVAGRRDVYAAALAACADRGVAAADLLTAIDAARRAGAEPFLPHDTHWSFDGIEPAAEAAAEAAGLRVPPEKRTTRLVPWFEIEAPSDILGYAGMFTPRPELTATLKGLTGRTAPPSKVWMKRVLGADGAPLDLSGVRADATVAVVGTSYSDAVVGPTFPAALAHAIDRPLRLNALSAAGVVWPLVTSYRIGLAVGFPRTTFWEVPSSLLFASKAPIERVGSFFAAASPLKRTTLVEGADAAAWSTPPPAVGSTTRYAATGASFSLRRGRVLHEGSGAVSVRLSGEVRGAPLFVRVSTGSLAVDAQWEPGTPEIVLPLLSGGPTGRAEVFVYGSDTEVAWRAVQIVADGERGASAAKAVPPTAIGDPGAGGTRSVAEFRFATPLPPQPFGYVEIAFAAAAPAPGDVEVVLDETSAATSATSAPSDPTSVANRRVVRFRTVPAGATLIVDRPASRPTARTSVRARGPVESVRVRASTP